MQKFTPISYQIAGVQQSNPSPEDFSVESIIKAVTRCLGQPHGASCFASLSSLIPVCLSDATGFGASGPLEHEERLVSDMPPVVP